MLSKKKFWNRLLATPGVFSGNWVITLVYKFKKMFASETKYGFLYVFLSAEFEYINKKTWFALVSMLS